MKILVTGATGQLGGKIVEFLLKKGYNGTQFVWKEGRISWIVKPWPPPFR